jgi:hypothetical protein
VVEDEKELADLDFSGSEEDGSNIDEESSSAESSTSSYGEIT